MNRKLFSALIPIFLIVSFGWTFYEQHSAKELLSEIAKTPENEVNAVMIRKLGIGKWVVLQNIPNPLKASFFSALANSESAMGFRPVTPYNNVVIRVETKTGTFDLDFRSHKKQGKWIKFTVVNRNYFGKSSFTQDHYGDFKSKELFKFLQYVQNES